MNTLSHVKVHLARMKILARHEHFSFVCVSVSDEEKNVSWNWHQLDTGRHCKNFGVFRRDAVGSRDVAADATPSCAVADDADDERLSQAASCRLQDDHSSSQQRRKQRSELHQSDDVDDGNRRRDDDDDGHRRDGSLNSASLRSGVNVTKLFAANLSSSICHWRTFLPWSNIWGYGIWR